MHQRADERRERELWCDQSNYDFYLTNRSKFVITSRTGRYRTVEYWSDLIVWIPLANSHNRRRLKSYDILMHQGNVYDIDGETFT